MAMKTGPLRRAVGTLGLAALAPTAYMLATGVLTPADAALRAGATLGVVVIVGRVASWWLSATAASLERAGAVRSARAEDIDAGSPVEGSSAAATSPSGRQR